MAKSKILVTFIEDPLGLLPDTIKVPSEINGNLKLTREDFEALAEELNRRTILSRIERLREHTQLLPNAIELHALAIKKGAGVRDIEGDWELRALVAEAELAAMYFKAERLPARARSNTAKAAAAAKLARDPKQAVKVEVFAMWQERHAGKHPRLRTNEQFATECMHRWPSLASVKVICGWCTEWTRAAKSQRAS